MKRLLPAIVAAAILLAPLSTPARAQNAVADATVALLQSFSPQRLSRIVIQWIVGALRTQMEITYEGLVVTPDGREAYLTGVAISPLMPWDARRECEIRVDRIDISESGGPDDLRLHLEFIGATAAPQCLEPGLADTVAVAGYDGLALERAYLDLDYRFGASSLTATLHAAIRDALVIEASADLAYVWLRESEDFYVTGEEFEPVIGLRGLEVRVEDAGALAALRPVLPSMGMEIDAIPPMVEGALREALAPMDGQSLPANTAAFIGNVRLAAQEFLANGGALTVAARPDRVLWLGPESLETPEALLDALSLEAGAGPLRARSALDPALIVGAVAGDYAGMTPDDKRAVAAHLMLTLGGPKATEAGRALLAPLADTGDAEAALILAKALAAADPEAAYRRGLFAANRTSGVLALLDEAEAALPLAAVLDAQSAAEDPAADAADAEVIAAADIALIRRAALAYMVGDGPARNYRRAYAMASLAAAAGDRASIDLRARLDRRLEARGAEDADLWRAAAASLADQALDVWVGEGLGAKLAP